MRKQSLQELEDLLSSMRRELQRCYDDPDNMAEISDDIYLLQLEIQDRKNEGR